MRRLLGLAFAALSLVAASAGAQPNRSFDLIIAGGQVLDGSGNPAFRADVGITGDRIVAVGDLSRAPAQRRIDATRKIVAPGFIDIHSHAFAPSGSDSAYSAEKGDPARLAAPNLVSQGVTTVVINQDGRSPPSISEQRSWLERAGIGPNALLMVGHGSVRGQVMGDDFRRLARPDEIARMRALVRDAMNAGAFGLTAGLEYTPGRWSNTDEVVELAREIVPYRGVYISHERSEGTDPMWFWPSVDERGAPTLLDAVSETIEIGERSGAVVVASHLKAKGAHYWGASRAAIQLIENARERGVQVYADQYPYETTGTDGVTVLLPPWALIENAQGIVAEGVDPTETSTTDYAARVQAVLADSTRAAALRTDIAHEIRRRGGAERLLILDHPDKRFIGRSLAEAARLRGVEPLEMAILLQTEGNRNRPGGAHLRGFSLSEIDLDLIAARNWTATASDAGIASPSDRFAHPRFYGTFPRKIRRYALERGVLTLEDAVRSATTLPAQILGLTDRGAIRGGMIADIVVFDPATIRDKSDAQNIHQFSEGVDWVLVNGQPVVAAGKLTGARPGRVVRNPRVAR
jgi:N-acyl-D-amino-acid deacylase